MNNALIINGFSKTYNGFALHNVSFQVPCGAIVGLVGENEVLCFKRHISLKNIPCYKLQCYPQ